MTATQISDPAAPDPAADVPVADNPQNRLAHLVLEDHVVTTLLRLGRPAAHAELAAAAEGFSLSRAALRDGMRDSQRVVLLDREYDLALRHRRKSLPREERIRQPMEAGVEELLREYAKPLPLPVITREMALMRGALPETIKDSVAGVLRSARFALETAPGTYLHRSLALATGAPREEMLIRENRLEQLAEWGLVPHLPKAKGVETAPIASLLDSASAPLPLKLLGYALWKTQQQAFNAEQLARTLGDRTRFYFLTGGYVTTQTAMEHWRGLLQEWISGISGVQVEALDLVSLLRTRPAGANARFTPQNAAATPTVAPAPITERELAELKKMARGSQALSVAAAIVDALEIEPEDPRFVPTLQALNETLRRDPDFLPVGIGRFLLRASVPAYVGTVPQELRPITLNVHDPETNEPLDFEMSDDGLEGDCADFVHSPVWEDVSEEVEVRIPRRRDDEDFSKITYVVLNHHLRAGTMKLRRQDEDFWNISGQLARLPVLTSDGQNLALWASRDSGLIYGLSDYLPSRAPASGASLEFERAGNSFRLNLGEPHKFALIEAGRAQELQSLRASATYLSLFELLQTVMAEHGNGAELETIWAEANMVRRTSKRLMCSVLSAYHCFFFKQRGPQQFLWRFEASRVDQGFKKNKRKFVRR